VPTDARDGGTRRSICWSGFEDTHRENEGFGRMEIYFDLFCLNRLLYTNFLLCRVVHSETT